MLLKVFIRVMGRLEKQDSVAWSFSTPVTNEDWTRRESATFRFAEALDAAAKMPIWQQKITLDNGTKLEFEGPCVMARVQLYYYVRESSFSFLVCLLRHDCKSILENSLQEGTQNNSINMKVPADLREDSEIRCQCIWYHYKANVFKHGGSRRSYS